MFWRLFVTHAAVAAAAAAVAGVLLQDRAALPALAAAAALALPPAYALARHFARPLEALARGAGRLAGGDFAHRVEPAGGPEARLLAEGLNAVGGRLAESSSGVRRDREQLRTILSGMVEGVVAFDGGQRVLFANERAGVAPRVPAGRGRRPRSCGT